MTLLEIADLHISYGPVDAVRGVTLDVEKGGVVAIVGPNGAGKTSILSAVQGLVRTRSGTIRLRGAEITDWSPERRARAGIAFVPESRGIFGSLSIAENLSLAACALAEKATAAAQIERSLELFPVLADRLNQRASVLSGGERQQLAIGRALVSSPDLLVLDEPSLGLAPVILDGLFASLAALRDEGRTILVVEQNVSRAVRLADHVYSLRGGLLERLENPQDLVGDPAFRAKHLGME
ncbi:ABC transporter ATP-binding protein [Nocardioides marmoriginsengisoli]|uniref:ABC transporter ATP-binding protein n=1 Tax=Nocardioides marmoriginsengisoli TaxID=661483 RepID=A0A3N0CGP3_9ACTN|nr:ABC transporter ATP-binding protein [Nocardioides marmoriginsengisoli]RNL62607.1 ABC transporter ATP-binding protein [Nocardioides marmoriginsengisoli]